MIDFIVWCLYIVVFVVQPLIKSAFHLQLIKIMAVMTITVENSGNITNQFIKQNIQMYYSIKNIWE